MNNLPVTDDLLARWPQKPETKKGKINLINSLFRTLLTYRNGVRDMNQRMARLLDTLSQVTRNSPGELSASLRSGVTPTVRVDTKPPIKLTFYYMPDSLYKLIPNELRFEREPMRRLLNAGRRGSVFQPVQKSDVPPVKIVANQPPTQSTPAEADRTASVMAVGAAPVAPATTPQTFIISRDALRKILNDL